MNLNLTSNQNQLDFPAKEVEKAWGTVQTARDPLRPKARDYIPRLFDGFLELHGDRLFHDDQALTGGIGFFEGKPVTILAQSKGSGLQDNLNRHFGMLQPEGYRKALRLARQAEKFGRPIICLIDTPGAYPGKGAEERGQAQAIAECLFTFSDLKVPVLSVVLSEGGSGGALALSVADRILMLENAVYSILSPEGFASILWKDESRAAQAAAAMKMTSRDLKEAGFADVIIPEARGGVQMNLKETIQALKKEIRRFLQEYADQDPEQVVRLRQRKIREWGVPGWLV